jgi:HEAT repeat protein
VDDSILDECFDRVRRAPNSPIAHTELLRVLRNGLGRERIDELLQDSDLRVVEAATFALSELGKDVWTPPRLATVIAKGSERSAYYAMEVTQLTSGEDSECVNAVLGLVESTSPLLRRKAMEVLAFLPASAVEAACDRLDMGAFANALLGRGLDKVPQSLRSKASAVCRIRSPLNVATVDSLLADDDADVRQLVADLQSRDALLIRQELETHGGD